MQRLIQEGQNDGVINLTATEICSLIAGGNIRASPDRLSAVVHNAIPGLVLLRVMDMVN